MRTTHTASPSSEPGCGYNILSIDRTFPTYRARPYYRANTLPHLAHTTSCSATAVYRHHGDNTDWRLLGCVTTHSVSVNAERRLLGVMSSCVADTPPITPARCVAQRDTTDVEERLVDLLNHLRPGDVEHLRNVLLVPPIALEVERARLEIRTHRAIEDDDALTDEIEKGNA